MKMVKLGYSVPEPVVDRLKRLNELTGISLQKAAAAGIYCFADLPPGNRDLVLRSLSRWLEAGAPLDDAGELPAEYRPRLAEAEIDEPVSPAEVDELLASLPESVRVRWRAKLAAIAALLSGGQQRHRPAGKPGRRRTG
jgi:hypothetical protein